MNPETLKLIIDALTQLGNTSADAFIWYLCAVEILPTLTWAAALVYTAKRLGHAILYANGLTGDANFIRECRDQLKIGCDGPLTGTERTETMQRITQLINNR